MNRTRVPHTTARARHHPSTPHHIKRMPFYCQPSIIVTATSPHIWCGELGAPRRAPPRAQCDSVWSARLLCMQVLTTAPRVPMRLRVERPSALHASAHHGAACANATPCGAPVAKPSRHHHEQHGIVINFIIVIIVINVINVISLTAIDHVPIVGKKHACGSPHSPFPPIGAPLVSSPLPPLRDGSRP